MKTSRRTVLRSLLGAAALPAIAPGRAFAQGASASFDLDALIAAAKKEGELNTLNNSGKVTTLAKDFEAKYGIKVNGTKADSATQVQQVTREVQSGNVKLGVLSIEDGAMLQGQLIPQQIVDNWVPPDMVDSIPKEWQNPLVQLWDAKVLSYNPDVYKEQPIANMWELTDEAWRGNVAIRDPLATPEMITYFSFLISDASAQKLAAAYQQKYGEELKTDEKNAGYEFIKRLAQNKPILTQSDGDASSAAGAPGQEKPPVALLSLGKFSEAPEQGLKIVACKEVAPWLGYAYPRYAVIAHGTPTPNAAKLYVHFLMTADGANPSISDHGGFSANTKVPEGTTKYFGTRDFWQQHLLFLAPEGNANAWDMRESLSDFWRLNHH